MLSIYTVLSKKVLLLHGRNEHEQTHERTHEHTCTHTRTHTLGSGGEGRELGFEKELKICWLVGFVFLTTQNKGNGLFASCGKMKFNKLAQGIVHYIKATLYKMMCKNPYTATLYKN